MSFLTWLRGLFASPVRIGDGRDPETAADLHEELGTPDEGAAEVKQLAGTHGGGGAYLPDEAFAAQESAEAAEADLESEEAPPDPDA